MKGGVGVRRSILHISKDNVVDLYMVSTFKGNVVSVLTLLINPPTDHQLFS